MDPMTDPMGLTRRQRWILVILAAGIALFSALRFQGPSEGYWDTYITVPAMFMTGHDVDLHRIDGSPRFDYQLKQRIPDDTFDPSPGGFGISSKDQRIGTAILFAAPFSLVHMAAFRWAYALTWTFLFLFAFLSLRRVIEGFTVPTAGALLLVLNPFSLYLDRLNGNLFGLALLVFLFFLLTARDAPWWMIGLVYGLAGGIRNEAIILGPMFLAFMVRRRQDRGELLRSFLSFTAAAFVAILPVLLWNRYAYGQMIIHPSQVPHLQGFRPTFPHNFFGTTFQFNGLLNAPFHDHLVRTPHFAFPTFLHWPLVTVKALGIPLAAAGLVGAVTLTYRKRFEGRVLLYWYAIVAVLFVFQENWEELKQTFMALHLFPLVAFVAAGLAWIAEGLKEWRRWAIIGGLSVVLLAAVLGARTVTPPADERWYVRFPHAATNDAGLDELPAERRKDWQFFYTRETSSEIAAERAHMTRPCLFPRLYRPWIGPEPDVVDTILREPSTTKLRTLAIWSYIYE